MPVTFPLERMGVSHSAQKAMAAMLDAAADGHINFVDDCREYKSRCEKAKTVFTDRTAVGSFAFGDCESHIDRDIAKFAAAPRHGGDKGFRDGGAALYKHMIAAFDKGGGFSARCLPFSARAYVRWMSRL